MPRGRLDHGRGPTGCLAQAALPQLLEQIATDTGEFLLLGTLEEAGVVHLDHIKADHAVKVAPTPGTHHSIRHYAMRKLILSQRPNLTGPWIAKDPAFRAELDKVRRTGTA